MNWVRTSLCLALVSTPFVFAAGCNDDETRLAASTSTTGSGGSGGAGGSGGSAPTGVSIPGLSAPVQAVYDENGLLHLSCATDNDCYSALGYFHASNRFFFMDFVRNLVRGRLGSLVKAGDTVLSQDYVNRQWFTTKEGEPLEEALYKAASSDAKGYLDAYALGVNAWIGDMRGGRNGATLTTEYDFALIVKENIRDWDPEDCAAVGLYVLDDLSNNSAPEIAMAAQIPLFDPAFAADLFSARPVFDAFTLPAGNSAPPSGILPFPGGSPKNTKLFEAAEAHMRLVGSGARASLVGEHGSNNWVVAPSRTAAGVGLLANDPHLTLTNPSIWFPVEIDAKSAGTGTFHVAGSTFPGLPAVMVGHNETVAWGVTTTYYDLADVYLEELSADGSAVKFEGGEVPIFEKEFSFENAASGKTVTKSFRWVPHHGPIVSEDLAAGTAVSIRWRGHDGGTDLDAFFAIGRSNTASEAKTALELVSSAAQNFVVLDLEGNIGWYPYSKLPARPWASAAVVPWLPLPADGTAEWKSEVPVSELPQLTNPPAGVIATANQDMTGASQDGDLLNDGQAAFQAFDKADGTREQRILDLLAEGGNAHSAATMHAMQGDTFSLYGTVFAPAVLAAASGATLTTDEQAVIDAIAAWDMTCPTGLDGHDPAAAGLSNDAAEVTASVGCAAMHATIYGVVSAALDDEIAAAGVTLSGRWDLLLVTRALRDPSLIATGDLLWDDVTTPNITETRDETLLRGVSLAAASLAQNGAPDSWQWGRMHTLSPRSIYDSFGVKEYNLGPYAAPGGLFTVNVANPLARSLPAAGKPWDFAFAAGPSVRFVVEALPEGMRMTYELPGGSDLHRESPFFNNLMSGWLDNKPIDFPFGPGAVTSPAATVEVSPGG